MDVLVVLQPLVMPTIKWRVITAVILQVSTRSLYSNYFDTVFQQPVRMRFLLLP